MNPIVLVGHSWAGVVVNEFLLLRKREGGVKVVGLVLVDANYETALEVLNPYNEDLKKIGNGVDSYKAYGLEEEHALTSEEWKKFRVDEESERFRVQAEKKGMERTRRERGLESSLMELMTNMRGF